MTRLTVKDLIDVSHAKLVSGNLLDEIGECFIDSSKVNNGGCFFGIKGCNTDGSLFYKEAFLNGASVCVINEEIQFDINDFKDKTLLTVKDTKDALQLLAKRKRDLFKGTVVAITGSVGKTSTKEMIYNILNKKYKVLKTIGNQNSQLGLPLTILRLKDEEVMVLEMGMNDLGQIEKLSLIARPDISVITNIYDSHIGILGSRENILKAKLEIVRGMKKGYLIVNNDNDMLYNSNLKNKNIDIITYGIKNSSDYMAYNVKEDDIVTFDTKDIKDIKIREGVPFVYNALASIIVGKMLLVKNELIKDGINDRRNVSHRLEDIKINNYLIIDDTYNASYESLKVALNYMSKINGRKVVILGDILELGEDSINIHKKIGKLLLDYNIDYLITIGSYSKYIDSSIIDNGFNKYNVKHFDNELNSRKFIKDLIKENDVVLIKGSNSTNLVNIIKYLKKKDLRF